MTDSEWEDEEEEQSLHFNTPPPPLERTRCSDIWRHLAYTTEPTSFPPLRPELEAAMAAFAPPRSVRGAGHIYDGDFLICKHHQCEFATVDKNELAEHYKRNFGHDVEVEARSVGCARCVESGLKCSSTRPACNSCVEANIACVYPEEMPMQPKSEGAEQRPRKNAKLAEQSLPTNG